MILCYALTGAAQNFSDDMQLVGGDDNTVTVTVKAVAPKKKDAERLAVQSAFNCLMHSGVNGIKGGMPILSEAKKDYDYRLFNENRYIVYIIGKPETVSTKKIANNQQATVRLTINLAAFKADLKRNKQIFSPAWADAKAREATSALNPTIVVVPYTDSSDGYSFEAMRTRIENNPIERYAVERVAEAFQNNGFKTRDFIAQLQNSKNRSMLREGAQSDVGTMMVQELPGDIVVTVGISAQSQGSTTRVSDRKSVV